jgi:hypothetical protein
VDGADVDAAVVYEGVGLAGTAELSLGSCPFGACEGTHFIGPWKVLSKLMARRFEEGRVKVNVSASVRVTLLVTVVYRSRLMESKFYSGGALSPV